MIRLFLAFSLFSSANLFSQEYYSYRFQGNFYDSEVLESKLLKIEGVQACKFRYKEEKQIGEIIIEIVPSEDKFKNISPMTHVKNEIINYGLNLIEITDLNK